MAINSVIRDYVGSIMAEDALAPSAPAIRAPNPFSDDERADIGYQKFGSRIIARESDGSSTATTASTGESDKDPKGYSGPLDVSRIYREQGAVLPEQGFFDKKFGSKPIIDPITGKVSYGVPRGLRFMTGGIGTIAMLGGAASRMNLERIYEKIQAGEEGYGLAMLNGRVVGVGPGPMDGSTVLSGVLPEGLTGQQRYQLGQSILAAGAPTDELAPPTPSFEEQVAQYAASGESPDGSSSLLSGGNINIVQDSAGRPVMSGGKPVTTSAGQYVNPALLQAQADAMKFAAEQNKTSTQPAPAPKPDPGGSSGPSDTSSGSSGMGGGSDGSGGLGGQSGGPRATGGFVGFAEGGNTQKDPIQRTGFVEGPPQEYAKGTTVADTENLRVREGSFVINAPMTEKLQKAGVLPKGNQKRKAAKGGKMMEVALSKGEYVVEPKDVPKFGGYGFLEAVNDMGKPEVERRQAAAGGGFIDGYAKGDRVKVYRGEPIDPSKAMTSTNYGYPKEDVGKFHTPLVERARNFASSAGPGNQLIRSRKVTVDELLDGVKEAFKVASRKKDNEYFKAMPKSELNKNLNYVDSLKKAYKSGERSLESFAFMLQEQVFHDESKIDFIETLKNDPKSAGKLAGRAIAKVATVATPPIAFLAGAAEMLTPSKLDKGTMFDDSFMTYTYTPTE